LRAGQQPFALRNAAYTVIALDPENNTVTVSHGYDIWAFGGGADQGSPQQRSDPHERMSRAELSDVLRVEHHGWRVTVGIDAHRLRPLPGLQHDTPRPGTIVEAAEVGVVDTGERPRMRYRIHHTSRLTD
jgi:hypothetical protein